jgi:hypothetical protein
MSDPEGTKCKAFDLCACCACQITEGGIRSNGKCFCCAECQKAHAVYRTLCKWAKRKACRFPKREVDFSKAQAFLDNYLRQLRSSRAKPQILTPV